MADLALAGLRWTASPIVNELLTKASAYLSVDMVREIQRLEATVLPQFELVIQAAQKSPHRGILEGWLRRLKEAYYDAEDLLDEHEYNVLEGKAKSGKSLLLGEHGSSSTATTVMKPFHAALSRARNLLPQNRRLLSKMNELKAILTEAQQLRDLLGLPHGNTVEWPAAAPTSVPTTTSLPTSKVFGRDRDRDHIVDFLLDKTTTAQASSAKYSGLAIVGVGGMGKSTLAQYVYNDKRIEECFDVRMWVCISRKLDVHRHTREIMESAKKGECPHVDNLDTLQCKLRDILQESHKFLLVLDDVWFEKSDTETEWELLLAPLVSKQSGSKVLVTTRCETLPAAVCCEQVVHLKNLDDTEFLALFKHHAFSGAEIKDKLLHTKLEHTTEEIAKRLGQCPLAAKVLGSRLCRKKDIAEWKAALKLGDLSDPFTSLLWSYEKLDPRLQRCFLYCSLFPKGHRYEPNELVHLWVAEGFVGSCNLSRRTLEEAGMDYFNDMVSGSFFQLVSKRHYSYYIMHDILHDLAESLSREDCFRLEDDNVTEIPCTVRYLSVRVESMQKHKEIIYKLHHLRTVICIDSLMDNASIIFDQMLWNLKKLRVLSLSFYNSNKLPKSVGELKHLRYLDLTRTSVFELPRSLCALWHLQLLQLNGMVERLPNKVCNLSKLRYLRGYKDQIPNIGKLTSLQQIYVFSVQKKQGYELRQLKDLNELGGSLHVQNLENVIGKDEALASKLYLKSRLKELTLEWSSENGMDAMNILHLDVLEGLRPPPQLSKLTIKGYKSDTYPGWLLERSYFKNLERFELNNCSLLEGLPPDTELLQHCSRLLLLDVPKLKTLPCLPPSLTKLSICGLPLLTFVTKNQLEQHDSRENIMMANHLASKLSLMWEVDSGSSVRSVLSKDYSSLKQLMTLMIDDDISKHLQIIESGLEEGDKVWMKENIIKAWLFCHEQRIRFTYGRAMELQVVLPLGLCKLSLSSCNIIDEALAICLEGLTSLATLELEYNMALTTLPSEEVFQHLTNLDMLILSGCWCLKSLGGLRVASSLSILHCWDCPSLELARGAELMPLNLASNLSIRGCILAADSFINGLPHLKHLSIDVCRSSPSLSIGHLTSLELLDLNGLPDLCFVEGLSSLHLKHLSLVDVANLTAKCISQFRVQESLTVSSSVLLNHMLMAEGFTAPPNLTLLDCKEPSFSFEEPANLSSVKRLDFSLCEMESLPRNLKSLSSLESLHIGRCPNVASLPDLPSSLQRIAIWCCPVLKKNCQEPDGESWPKISHLRWKHIY
ncbi:putative disease resistance protein RGA4 [Zea mays]|uniref:Rust resistance protein Rp1-dp3 n=2 Tax=Zea mays TaxID=4577 RepID=Q8S454_MAIZE|nr:putative disease resistance protein RGA4 [Zea mays]AAM03018.1 rust resistance-like protein RP1-3 [Zea mays]AQK39119.1 Rust resistance protein Rp1-dp3 [Zea mays]|eukprot:XP_008662427.1 putative disease resistance protein RGA4 [Zea mays]